MVVFPIRLKGFLWVSISFLLMLAILRLSSLYVLSYYTEYELQSSYSDISLKHLFYIRSEIKINSPILSISNDTSNKRKNAKTPFFDRRQDFMLSSGFTNIELEEGPKVLSSGRILRLLPEPTKIFKSEWAFEFRASLQRKESTRGICPPIIAFFKMRPGIMIDGTSKNMMLPQSECDLREIKIFALNVLLDTHLVAPTMGHIFNLVDVMSILKSSCRQNSSSHCDIFTKLFVKMTNTNNTSQRIIGSSATMWFKRPLDLGPKDKGLSQKRLPHRLKDGLLLRFPRLREYAILNYLGRCHKTTYVRFANGNRSLVMMDNDRCFMPDAVDISIIENKEMELSFFEATKAIVFQSCSGWLRDIYDILRNSVEAGPSLGKQLEKLLSEDERAEELLAFQPETHSELDNRVLKVVTFVNACLENHGPAYVFGPVDSTE